MATSNVNLTGIDLLSLIGPTMRRVAGTHGGEWAGPCPFCGGKDRFRAWPKHPSGKGRFWCRQCEAQGDAIEYLRKRDGLGFREACERLGMNPTMCDSTTTHVNHSANRVRVEPPRAEWQATAKRFVEHCQDALYSPAGSHALGWLHARGLAGHTILGAGLGYNRTEMYQDRQTWGLNPEKNDMGHPKRVWLPVGVTIPWQLDGELWRIQIRRLEGEPRYVSVSGSGNVLFNADAIGANKPALLLEGVIDALTVQQHAGDLVVAVATGATTGARRPRWVGRLALAPLVLVAFDTDDPGEFAAKYWLGVLPNAKRWRSFWADPNAMAQDNADIRAWVAAGLGATADEDVGEVCVGCGAPATRRDDDGLAWCDE